MEKQFNKIKKIYKRNNKIKIKLIRSKILRAKKGGKIGDKLVASFYEKE